MMVFFNPSPPFDMGCGRYSRQHLSQVRVGGGLVKWICWVERWPKHFFELAILRCLSSLRKSVLCNNHLYLIYVGIQLDLFVLPREGGALRDISRKDKSRKLVATIVLQELFSITIIKIETFVSMHRELSA